MSFYKYIRDIWKQPKENNPILWKERLISWRKQPVTVRVDKPTRIDRARSLGYKAKPGIFVVRQKVYRGGHKRPNITGGRRPKHNRQRLTLDKNYKQIAEERANKKFVNCEVLNSYYVAHDGKNYWYEVILVDTNSNHIKKTPLAKLTKGRVYRGLTSAGRKSRGLMNKGKGTEKLRPSRNAVYNRKANRPRRDVPYKN